MLQLNPPLPLVTPRGKGIAVLVSDPGSEQHLEWTVLQDNGEVWTWRNPDVRAQGNVTAGRSEPLPPIEGSSVTRAMADHDYIPEPPGIAERPVIGDPDGARMRLAKESAVRATFAPLHTLLARLGHVGDHVTITASQATDGGWVAHVSLDCSESPLAARESHSNPMHRDSAGTAIKSAVYALLLGNHAVESASWFADRVRLAYPLKVARALLAGRRVVWDVPLGPEPDAGEEPPAA